MNASLNNLSPSITAMIRMDHTHAMAVFHRYKVTTSDARKSALVRNVCLALEVHAQLEEEIFYPALRQAAAAATRWRRASRSMPRCARLSGACAPRSPANRASTTRSSR
jgi:hypothetical protein